MTRQLQKKGGDKLIGNKRKLSNQQRITKLNNKWKKKVQKQNKVIAALRADTKVDSDRDDNDSNATERKSNKKFKFNSGVTQRKHTDQE